MRIMDHKNKKRVTSTSERLEALEKEAANLSMAIRVNQALLKQFMDQLRPMQDDLTRFYGALNDTQYRLSAIVSTLNLDKNALAKEADKYKLVDWQEASDKDDAARSLESTDAVSSSDDIVIITSTTPDEAEDRGIFRSKTALSEIANKDIAEGLLGKSVGYTLETVINGSRHVVELVGVRIAPKEATTPQAEGQ
jgi:hypothetical protein